MDNLVEELRQHAKAAWLTLYRQHPCWKAADRIEALTAASPPASGAVEAGLSEWSGWDRSRGDWSETKHKDAVLSTLFDGAWSMEDAAALIGFIDRTWTKRRAAPTEGR